MPFFYDITRQTATATSAGAEQNHLWGKTIANQETVGIYGLYAAARFGTAGGAILRLYQNTGTTASGGTNNVPSPKNIRGQSAALSQWLDDTTGITSGTTRKERIVVGFALTGGQGGYVPIVPTAAVQMMPNTTQPVDVEVASIAAQISGTFDMALEIGEGI